MSAHVGTSDPMSSSLKYCCSNSHTWDDTLCYRKSREGIDQSDALRGL